MNKKKWIAMLAMLMSLSFCVVGASCGGDKESASSADSMTNSSVTEDSVSEESSTTEENSSSDITEDSSSDITEDSSSDSTDEQTHTYVKVNEKPATYFEEGVKEHYTCGDCEGKFVMNGTEYVAVSDADLVIAKKTIAEETTPASVDTNSSDLINTIVADKVKGFDQAEPTYVTMKNGAGDNVQAVYFSKTGVWDATQDGDNNGGFVEFRIPVNANTGGISFAYKLLDKNNDTCTTVGETDKAYGMKSYVEYKMNGEYVNVSKDLVGNICLMADGEWNEFVLDCTKADVECIIIKIYHFEGELAVTNMQTLTAKHIHETTEVAETEETCTENGNTTYYTCTCGKFYADAEATQEIVENSWVLPAHHVLSETLEYNETHHYFACTVCDYKQETAHAMSDWVGTHIGEKTSTCDCGYVATADENVGEIDFTKSLYGAAVYSVEAQTEFADRITETSKNSIKYLLYHDNGVVKAAHKVMLPRIDFTKFGQVSVKVFFDEFLWDQQFGLTEDSLTNSSDTYVEPTSYNGKLTFTWKDGALQMKLAICGKTFTQTITDADIINGNASAYFYLQAYYERYVTLSNFAFIAPEDVNPYGEQYAEGYATVLNEQYDADKRLVGLTMEIPAGLDWWVNAPVLTQDYLNALCAEKLECVTINVTSTTDTNNFITMYNGVPNYNANVGSTVTLVENGGHLQFSYVDLNNDGKTVATTLTLSISYSVNPQTIADEIGLTLASGVNIRKDSETSYTISNANGYQRGVSFSAEQVNAWLDAGYNAITLQASFTPSDDIDQIVGYATSLSFFTNESGYVEWTISLKENEAIDFWAQKSGNVSGGAFTFSNVQLTKEPPYAAGYTTVSDVTYDGDFLTGMTMEVPDNTEWSGNAPYLTQAYLNMLYKKGIRSITIGVDSTATDYNFITYYGNQLDYDSRDGYTVALVQNGGDLKVSYVNLNNNGYTVATTLTMTFTYQYDPALIAGEIGLSLTNGVNITKDAEGVYTVSNMNGYENGVYFSKEQVNAWIAQGYTSISMTLNFTVGEDIDLVVSYTATNGWWTNGDSLVEWTFSLNADEAITIWAQKGDTPSAGAITFSQVTLN